MTFAETTRAMRAAKQLRQQDLAQTVGVTRQTIHSIENGKTVPTRFAAAE